MLLMIDNYDSFVYNLVRYFEELGEEIKVFRNDKIEIEDIKNMKIDGIVISPGPKSPKEAGLSLEIIDNFKGKLPILGICLGHQCIGEYFNANIKKGKEPVHGGRAHRPGGRHRPHAAGRAVRPGGFQREEEVQEQCAVGNHTRDEAIHGTHIDHQQYQSYNE